MARTPTTDEVRTWYGALSRTKDDVSIAVSDEGVWFDEFDRWLERHDREVAAKAKGAVISALSTDLILQLDSLGRELWKSE